MDNSPKYKWFADNLNDAMTAKEDADRAGGYLKDGEHYSETDWARALHIGQSSLNDYRNGKSIPRVDKLFEMSRYLPMDIRELTNAYTPPFEDGTFADYENEELDRLQHDRYGNDICDIIHMLTDMKPGAIKRLKKLLQSERVKGTCFIKPLKPTIKLPPMRKVVNDGLESHIVTLQDDGTYK